MNRLQYETSPYLLQHAANPVDWHPWSEEALALAQKAGKPILVSIGYSTCHWCHVMERESFEDPDVAAIMNAHFVCIKVDREERPDVDQIYMEACQAISGGGGWPLNAFLLPDGRPFYAGTYFPPRAGHNRPGWTDLLLRINKVWREDRAALEGQAEQITKGILENSSLFIESKPDDNSITKTAIDTMIGQLKQRYDLKRGGFGGAPKFPMSQSLELLLDYGILYDDAPAIQLVEHATLSMIGGGIYDQLRGGFARYTVDGAWRIPHFEKMLYDNALLLRLLGKLQMLRPKAVYAKAIRETVDWLRLEMQSPDGAFYAALDADSEGVEGKFYVWSYAELKPLLSEAELAILTDYFGLTEAGNWEEEKTNILYRNDVLPPEQAVAWETLKEKLLEVRATRIRPGRDEKIILQWNALLISGLCYVYRATQDASTQQLAMEAYESCQRLLYKDGHWHRNYKDGKLGKAAFLDDLTALNTARLDLYDITSDFELLIKADNAIGAITERFAGAPGGLYYLTEQQGGDVPFRTLDLYDNALPSGNGQLLHLLFRLGAYTGKVEHRRLVEEKIKALVSNVLKYPTSFANLGCLLLLLERGGRELVISGPDTKKMVKQLGENYRPDLTIVAATTKFEEFPSLAGRYHQDTTQLYLCEQQVCKLPVADPAELTL